MAVLMRAGGSLRAPVKGQTTGQTTWWPWAGEAVHLCTSLGPQATAAGGGSVGQGGRSAGDRSSPWCGPRRPWGAARLGQPGSPVAARPPAVREPRAEQEAAGLWVQRPSALSPPSGLWWA